MTAKLTDEDLFLFNEGTHRRLGEHLGAHLCPDGGTSFAVWAPAAAAVHVIGDWNGWNPKADPLEPVASSGVWAGTLPHAERGQVYKYSITAADGRRLEKADPVALCSEPPPRTGSVIWDLAYEWGDDEWMAGRLAHNRLCDPMSVYEVHLGSWRRDPGNPDRLLSYREVAPLLTEHVVENGFTHVEFMPLMEHPFYGSWGYQVTGLFAPSRRYGDPQDLMALVDQLHQAGIGVIFDWVPSHFPTDAHGLGEFDGTHLYEHADPKRGLHPDWNTYVFNYARHEVRSFLASSAEHWLSCYHGDGLRVDAVASMLYLDYSRNEGEWVPNRYGGREDLDAVSFLRQLNAGAYADHPDIQMIAEESTAWPGVSRPVEAGGLGFGLKWDMGWMHDTLAYMSEDPVHRRYHHGEITFRGVYAFTENFVLPLSHDEVVHGKGSLLDKMPGDDWQKLANLRLLYSYQYGQPGKKLLFMGSEFAPRSEWDHDRSLDWHLLREPGHEGVRRLVADLNRLHRSEPALHELDTEPEGFEWVQVHDAEISVLSFLRRAREGRPVLVVANFTPVPRHNLVVGVPEGGCWEELLNSDSHYYGGSGTGNLGSVVAHAVPAHGRPRALNVTLPPLGCLFLAPEVAGPLANAPGDEIQGYGSW
jgi:1,4-alpha-glucan branching enzyme